MAGGLLDAIFPAGDGGGLLDFLKRNAQMQAAPSGLPSDQAQYGAPQMPGLGSGIAAAPALPSQAGVSTPQVSAPVFASAPSVPDPAGSPPVISPQVAPGGGIGAAVRGALANMHNGPVGLIGGAIAGGMGMGQPTADQIKARERAALIYGLQQRGVSTPDILAGLANPEYLKKVLDNSVKEKEEYRPATPEERNAAGLGSGSNTPMFINKSTNEPKFGPAQTNVNVSTEKTGQAELVKQAVESHVAAQNAARESQKRVALYDAFEKAAQGFTPGATAEARLTAKRYLKDAGVIQGADVPDGEIMKMISDTLAVHAQPKGQGAVSNYERGLFAKSLPNMSQSPEGLRRAIGISRKLERYDQQVAQIYRESAGAHNGLPNYLEVQERIAKLGSPLSDDDMTSMSGGGTATAAKPIDNRPWKDIGGGVKIRPKD